LEEVAAVHRWTAALAGAFGSRLDRSEGAWIGAQRVQRSHAVR